MITHIVALNAGENLNNAESLLHARKSASSFSLRWQRKFLLCSVASCNRDSTSTSIRLSFDCRCHSNAVRLPIIIIIFIFLCDRSVNPTDLFINFCVSGLAVCSGHGHNVTSLLTLWRMTSSRTAVERRSSLRRFVVVTMALRFRVRPLVALTANLLFILADLSATKSDRQSTCRPNKFFLSADTKTSIDSRSTCPYKVWTGTQKAATVNADLSPGRILSDRFCRLQQRTYVTYRLMVKQSKNG